MGIGLHYKATFTKQESSVSNFTPKIILNKKKPQVPMNMILSGIPCKKNLFVFESYMCVKNNNVKFTYFLLVQLLKIHEELTEIFTAIRSTLFCCIC